MTVSLVSVGCAGCNSTRRLEKEDTSARGALVNSTDTTVRFTLQIVYIGMEVMVLPDLMLGIYVVVVVVVVVALVVSSSNSASLQKKALTEMACTPNSSENKHATIAAFKMTWEARSTSQVRIKARSSTCVEATDHPLSM